MVVLFIYLKFSKVNVNTLEYYCMYMVVCGPAVLSASKVKAIGRP